MKNFKELCVRTESRDFVSICIQANRVSNYLTKLLTKFVNITDTLDECKKNIFYIEPIETDPEREEYNNPRFKDQTFLRLLHAGIGMATEAGEFLRPILDYIEGSETLDCNNLLEEVADSQWYQSIIFDALEVEEDDVRAMLIDKLTVRYPEKFTEYNALNRDLLKEKKALRLKSLEEKELTQDP